MIISFIKKKSFLINNIFYHILEHKKRCIKHLELSFLTELLSIKMMFILFKDNFIT